MTTAQILSALTAFRRDIHAHPELAFAEYRTAERITAFLNDLSKTSALAVEVHTGIAGTGVVAVLRHGEGASIGLRADMDALPMEEANTCDHRSRAAGKMHGCGHDGHIAMLLGAAHRLAHHPHFSGTVHFIFQPAEEHAGGAQAMIEAGLLQRFPMDYVFGLHNWPGLPENALAIRTGAVMAATDRFDITLRGMGGHAAMPHQTTDVIVAGAALIQALQTLVSRSTDPLQAAVCSVTRFHGGDPQADNVLPPAAVLGGTCRCFDPDLRHALEAGLRRITAGIASTFNISAEVVYECGYPPTRNDPDAARHCVEAARRCTDKVLLDCPPSMGAEDFAYYGEHLPSCYAWLGAGPGQGGCMLHSPHYDFNDALLPVGIEYWAMLARQVLPPAQPEAT
jgi:amidohydrolase